MTKIIDGALFSRMIISGAHNLTNNRELVDSLNVFPVPDGDTGTNMSLTFINAARTLESGSFEDVGDASNAVAKATLRGARGNSGVILSQIFRGISKKLTDKKEIDVNLLKEAFRGASDTAYRAVMKPTEGTILTVIRSVAEAGEGYEGDDIEELIASLCEKGNIALKETTNMLPQLKQAGVCDAGGQGLMFILEGFLSCLRGKEIALNDQGKTLSQPQSAQSTIKTEDIKYAYCTEFIINKHNPDVTAAKMRAAIEPKGDCLIVIDEDDIVKVHIHTNHPGFVLEQAVKIGEMVNIKIENMKQQHTEILLSDKDKEKAKAQEKAMKKEENNEPKKKLGIISVCNGDGLEKTFRDLGADIIVNGGQTMNPSTEDILEAIEKAHAENVIVLPNNKNIVLASTQAAKISEDNVIVIESKTIPQGISAMMAYSNQADIETNTNAMKKALGAVESGSITHAVKDTELDGLEIHEGDIIGVSGSHILSSGKSIDDATLTLVEKLANEDSEIITLYYGEDVKEEDAEKLCDMIEEKFPDADVLPTNGGQSVYYYIVSVE